MTLLIIACLAAFVALLWLLRRDRVSLGLPIAYLYSLLLIHLPGAFAHIVGGNTLTHSDLVGTAMRFTALGSACFVIGVWLARPSPVPVAIDQHVERTPFWSFCLFGGWICIYGLTPLYDIPSVAAAVDKGAAIWMLGVMLGLRAAVQRADRKWVIIWLAALMVFPVLMLLLGGFLSYGSAAIILVFSAITISTRNYWRVITEIVVFTFLSLSIFVNYFNHRENIRTQVWGGAPLQARIDSVLDTANDFEWFDANPQQLHALDQRLNQNYFVGLAARRIEQGQADYLKGETVWDGFLALVPRVVWPEKPVFGGSPEIVSRMTGLRFNRNTSVGVGNVMEFQINFGIPGVAVGFLVLGWLIGKLDYTAAAAERRGSFGGVILCFLPCVALIQPNGSIVELAGGAAAALVAAYAWKWTWTAWSGRATRKHRELLSPSAVPFKPTVQKPI